MHSSYHRLPSIPHTSVLPDASYSNLSASSFPQMCLIAAVAKADNWPIKKEILIKKHYKAFVKFTKQIDKIKEMN